MRTHLTSFLLIMIHIVSRIRPKKLSFEERAVNWAACKAACKAATAACLAEIRDLCGTFDLLCEIMELGMEVRSGEFSCVGFEIMRLLKLPVIHQDLPEVAHFTEIGCKAIRCGMLRRLIGK